MLRGLCQLGLDRNVVDSKWPGFEAAFRRLAPGLCAMMDDAWLAMLRVDRNIEINRVKVNSVQKNAVLIINRLHVLAALDNRSRNDLSTTPQVFRITLTSMPRVRAQRYAISPALHEWTAIS